MVKTPYLDSLIAKFNPLFISSLNDEQQMIVTSTITGHNLWVGNAQYRLDTESERVAKDRFSRLSGIYLRKRIPVLLDLLKEAKAANLISVAELPLKNMVPGEEDTSKENSYDSANPVYHFLVDKCIDQYNNLLS